MSAYRGCGGTGHWRVTGQRGVSTRSARRWWEPPDGPERARDKARNNKETGKNHGGDASDLSGEARPFVGTSSEGKNGPYHSTRKGWKHQEEHGWRRQRTGWYFVGTRIVHQAQFNRASRTNCQQDSQPILKPVGCMDEEVT